MQKSKAEIFLNGVRSCIIEARSLSERLEYERSRLYPGALRIKPVTVQESPPTDKMAESFARLTETEAALQKRVETLDRDIAYAHEVIAKIDDSRYRQALTLYYLSTMEIREMVGKPERELIRHRNYDWDDVADEMGISQRHAWNLGVKAREEFERLADL